jgi:hypothetical protein
MVVVVMTTPINSPRGAERRRLGPVVAMITMRHGPNAPDWEKRENGTGSAQPFEKARFGQGNPREFKKNPLIFFDQPWPDFAGF